MKMFIRYAIAAIALISLIGCQTNPSNQQIKQDRITGFTPFDVTGGYDVGSLIDYSNQTFKTLFTSEYIEINAEPTAQNALHKLFHTPLTSVSPRYNDNQKQQFMEAIKRTLLTSHFNLSDNAKAAIYKINKIDIVVDAAITKKAANPEELQYKIIEAIPSRGGTIIGITSKTGMAETPVAVTSILAFNQARVTVYFDSSVSSAERMEIFDKIHFDDRVTIRLGSMKDNSLTIEYTKPTIVAFKGYQFDTQAARFYRKNGRLPTSEDLLTMSEQKKKRQKNAPISTREKRSVNYSDMHRMRWD